MENRKELEERCYDICPEQPMLLLERCSAIVKEGLDSVTDRRVLKRALTGLKLHPYSGKNFWKSCLRMTASVRARRKIQPV